MAQTVLLKRSSVAGNVPDSSDLALGEIAVNTADGAVYIKKGNNDIVAVADNDILHIDTSNGRVGIGTTAPETKLHVANGSDTSPAVIITGGHTGRRLKIQSYQTGGASGAGFLFNADSSYGALKFQTTSTDRMIITQPGSVGIGTNNPVRQLHVYQPSGTNVVAEFESSDAQVWIDLQDSNSGSYGCLIGHDSAADHLFMIADENVSRKLVIDNSGNVGIGTSSPTVHSGTGFVVHATTGGSGNTGSPRIRLTNTTTGQSATDGAELSIDGNTKDFYIENREGQDIILYSGSERMRIDSSGNLLVGTTSAGNSSAGFRAYAGGNGAFTIAGTVLDLNRLSSDGVILNFQKDTASVGNIRSFGGDLIIQTGITGLRFQDGADAIHPVIANGSVSNGATDLGLTNARFKDLHLSGVANAAAFQSNQTATGFGYLNFGDTDDANIGQIGYDHTDNYMRFQVNNTEKVRIIANGNVGIGTTSPASNLHIKTSVDNSVAQGLVVERSANSDRGYINYNGGAFQFRSTVGDPIVFGETDSEHLRIAPDGNVGIGTTSPSKKFEVHDNGKSFKVGEKSGYAVSYGPIIETNSDAIVMPSTVWVNNSNVRLYKTGTSARLHGDGGIQFGYYNGSASVEGMRLTNGGYLGIGTTSPGYNFQVVGSGDTIASVVAGNSSVAGFNMGSSGTPADGGIRYDNSADKLIFRAGNATKAELSSTGALTLNSAYTFPTADGSANQVLQTDGSGNLTFASVSGGSGTITGVSNMADNRVITAQGSTTINAEANLTFDGTTLVINTSPAGTYGVSEALRMDDNGSNNDRQLQFFELCNAGARSHRLAFNTNITTTGSAYVYTQGNYGGSSQILFGNSGAMIFYVNSQTTGGSTTAITPTERFRLESDGKAKFTGDVHLEDSKAVYFGAGNDLQLYHNGSHSLITNQTGDLYIRNQTNDGDILFQGDDGSGGDTEYFRVDGGADRTVFSRSSRHSDNVVAAFGTSEDLQIYHNGSNSYIDDGGTGSLLIRGSEVVLGNGSKKGVRMIADGAVQLRHNDSTKLETTSTGVEITGNLDSPQISINDYISHNGDSNTFLGFDAADTFSLVTGGTTALSADANATHLRYQGSAKLSTAADGIILSSSDATGAAGPVIDFNRDSASPADADYLGQLKFRGENDADQDTIFAKITAKAADVSDGTEDGAIEFTVKKAGSNNINARLSANNLDLINGTGLSVAGNATITGNLTVNGSTTTLNTATLDVEDKNITLNKGSGDTSGSANGAGITIQDAVDASNDATILWDASNDQFDFSHTVDVNGNVEATNIYVGSQIGHLGDTDTRLEFTANNNMKLIAGGATHFHAASDQTTVLYGGNSAALTLNTVQSAIFNNEIIIPASIVHSGDSDTFFGFHSNDLWRVVTGGVERFEVGNTGIRVNDTGIDMDFTIESNNDANMFFLDGGNDRIGIGTSNPLAKLAVHGPGATLAKFVANSNSDDALVRIIGGNYNTEKDARLFLGEADTYGMTVEYDGNSNIGYIGMNDNVDPTGGYSKRIGMSRGGTEVFFTAGNVGIGTTSPARNLHVHASNFTDLHLTNDTTGATASDGTSFSAIGSDIYLTNREAGNMVFQTSGTERMRIDSSGKVRIGATLGLNHLLNIQTASTSGLAQIEFRNTQAGSQIGMPANTNALSFFTADAERIRITNTGNVGIGTTSPGRQLELKGQAVLRLNGTDTDPGIDFQTDGTNDMQFRYRHDDDYLGVYSYGTTSDVVSIKKSNGNVGIGTTTPTSKVHISGTSDGSGSGADAMLHVKQNGSWNGNEPWALYVEGYSYLNGFRINAADGIRSLYKTTSGGTLGFATSDTAPITFTQSNSAEKMRIHSNGNVGIGSTAPAAKLQVEEYGVDTTSTASSATTQIAIHSFAAATFRSARFTVQVTNSTDSTYHTTELLLIHDGTTANITEFGEIHTGSAKEATFDADINSGNVRLLATPATTDTMAFKVVCHSITT